jgi:predicted RNA-binding Zn-ribbon protein involved in translation (DUF1610 family)
MGSYQSLSNPTAIKVRSNLARNWGFPCPMCGGVGIVRTDRMFWYACWHCGYEFGIERTSMEPQEEVDEDLHRG